MEKSSHVDIEPLKHTHKKWAYSQNIKEYNSEISQETSFKTDHAYQLQVTVETFDTYLLKKWVDLIKLENLAEKKVELV